MYTGSQHDWSSCLWEHLVCLLEKGLGFSLELGKVCRCPLDKICHLVHLGTGSAPAHPSPSHPPVLCLKVGETEDLYRWPMWASEKSLRKWVAAQKPLEWKIRLGSWGTVHSVGLSGSDECAAMEKEQAGPCYRLWGGTREGGRFMTPWSETSWKTLQNVLRTVSLEAWKWHWSWALRDNYCFLREGRQALQIKAKLQRQYVYVWIFSFSPNILFLPKNED